MTRFVIDAPTLVHLVGEGVVVDPAHRLVAPNALRSQALGLLYDSVRRGELTEKAALAQHERVTELKIRLLGDRASRGLAWRVARDQGWETLGDAELVAIARLQADAVVTVDARRRSLFDGLVPLASVEDLTRP